MPSVSEKQARFMAAAAHDPAFAQRVGIKQSVAQDFNQADKGSALLSKATSALHSSRRRPIGNLRDLAVYMPRMK